MSGFVEFDGVNPTPIRINYSVPLPGQVTGRRVVALDLGLTDAEFTDAAKAISQTWAELAGIEKSAGGVEVNTGKAADFLRGRLREVGYSAASVERAVSRLPALLSRQNTRRLVRLGPDGAPLDQGGASITPLPGEDNDGVIEDPVLGDPFDLIKVFAEKASLGIVAVPGKTGGGKGTTEEAPNEGPPGQPPVPAPQFFLIEVYEVSSILGDYGLGRTVRTFTLLPGESTTIKLKTWQTTTESRESASSIIDSHEDTAKERFANTVQNETTDKRTKESSKKWGVEAKASASWGWGSASVTANASGEHHASREQFAKSASEAVGEHAREASSRRELSVTSTSETSVETGQETMTERVIANVNMRRVLNFVFRELNQTYTTRLHLKSIKVAFSNGSSDSWREVPLSGLRSLLEELVVPAERDVTARRVLKAAGTVFDQDDVPVRTIEQVSYDPAADDVQIADAQIDAQGDFAAPTPTKFYRFKRGPLGQANLSEKVDGVLLSSQEIVMRTDSVIVEALLGQADALDNYAMEIQQAAATRETLANDREQMLQDALKAIQSPEDRAEAAAKIFGCKADGEGG